MSYQKIAEIINVFTGVDISRSFVFHQESILSEDYIEKRMDKLNKMIEEMGIEPSGVFNYDEQYLWVNTELKMRMTILDTNTKLVIADEFIAAEEFNKNTIRDFLNRNLKGLDVKCIVTDGNNSYPSIIEAIGCNTPKLRLS